MRRRSLLVALAVLLSLGLAGLLSAAPPAARKVESSLAYIERVTAGAEPEAALPMVLVLHGLGASPEDIVELLGDFALPVRLIAPRAPDPWRVGTSWFPMEEPARWPRVIAARAQQLAELSEQLRKRRPTRGLPVVTGFSQGGVLSFALAAYHADRLRGALPIAGALPADMPAPAAAPRGFRVVAFHGEEDARIRHQDGLRTVKWLKRFKRDAQLHSYPRVGHSVPEAMRQDVMDALRQLLTAKQ